MHILHILGIAALVIGIGCGAIILAGVLLLGNAEANGENPFE